jgi:(R,R)-butanediol dehydrogenase/meso-butanediol dehydrogenase/diacetyl reductase
MKVAIFRGKRNVEVTDVPVPQPDVGEALIKVHDCGICGSDVGAYRTGAYEVGLIIGHEFAGRIVGLGPEVYDWSVGDRVTCNGVIPCGTCWFCQHAMYSLCDSLLMTGVNFDGAFAEYVKVPARGLYRLPDNVSDREAAIVDPLSNILRAIRISQMKPGDNVLVLGAGPMGLLTIECARLCGANKVFVTEISPKRADLARQLGADAVIDPRSENVFTRLDELTGGRAPDIVFECAGVPQTLRDAVTLVRKGGQIVLIALCEEPVDAVDFMTPVMNELSFKGSYCGYEEYPMAIGFLAQGRVDVKPLISDVISINDIVPKGFEVLAKPGPEAAKILVEFPWP